MEVLAPSYNALMTPATNTFNRPGTPDVVVPVEEKASKRLRLFTHFLFV